jgi:potassium efflux system protein
MADTTENQGSGWRLQWFRLAVEQSSKAVPGRAKRFTAASDQGADRRQGFHVLKTLSSMALLLATVCLPALVPVAAADDAAADAGTASVLSIELLKSRAAEAAASTELDDADKATLAELYRNATSKLELAASHRETAERYGQVIAGGIGQIAEAEAERDAAAQTAAETPDELTDLTLPEMEQQLQRAKADVAVAESRLTEFEGRLAVEKERPAAIRQRLAAAESELSNLPSPTETTPATEVPPKLAEARRWADRSRRELLRAERLMLEQELSSQPLRLRLLEARRELADITLSKLQDQVDRLERMANSIRLVETEAARAEAVEAEREAATKHEVVAELAARNTRLSEEIDRLAKEIDDIDVAEAKSAVEAKRIEESFQSTRQKLEIAGLSQVLGQVLQQEMRSLPDTGHFEKQALERERKIADTSL